METKTEKITKLIGIINKKSIRIKELKLECGRQATKICVLNLRIKELEAQLEQHRWIPISERLPENVATVFIFTGEGAGGVGFYGEDETGYIWERLDHAINLNITHWKPIIEP